MPPALCYKAVFFPFRILPSAIDIVNLGRLLRTHLPCLSRNGAIVQYMVSPFTTQEEDIITMLLLIAMLPYYLVKFMLIIVPHVAALEPTPSPKAYRVSPDPVSRPV